MLTPAEARRRWRGVVAPLITPFAYDLSVDLPALRANVQWLFDRGAKPGNTILADDESRGASLGHRGRVRSERRPPARDRRRPEPRHPRLGDHRAFL